MCGRLTLLLLFLFSSLLLYLLYVFWANPQWDRSSAFFFASFAQQENDSVLLPLILGWNDYFQYGNIVHVLATVNNVAECPHKCAYSSDRKDESRAQVIVFHVRFESGQFPTGRRPNQLYTFFLNESPTHTWADEYRRMGADYFNLTMTYRTDSDIWYPYGRFEQWRSGIDGPEARWSEEEVDAKIAGKRKLVLQIVSNCATASRREEYLRQLQEHANVTVLGGCAPPPAAGQVRAKCDSECEDRELDAHFFYLAFENSVCRQYVSEKFWHVKRLIVPVVLSRAVFANLTVPEGAFIAADDFQGPKELAAHLVALSRNVSAYRRHFEWTRHFKKTVYHRSAENPLCRLCEIAREKPARERVVRNVWQFWEQPGICRNGYAAELLTRGGKGR